MIPSRKRIVIEFPAEAEGKVLPRVADIIMAIPGTTWIDKSKELEVPEGRSVIHIVEYYPPDRVSGQTYK